MVRYRGPTSSHSTHNMFNADHIYSVQSNAPTKKAELATDQLRVGPVVTPVHKDRSWPCSAHSKLALGVCDVCDVGLLFGWPGQLVMAEKRYRQ